MTASGSAQDAVAGPTAAPRTRELAALRKLALGVALAAPVIAYVVYVTVYGVNTPWNDDFGKIPIVQDLLSGRLSFDDLWRQQNEHRLIITLLFVELPIAAATHFNLHAAMLAGAALLVIAGWILAAAYVRSGAPLWAAVPCMVLLFSLVQFANSLFAYENVYLGLVGAFSTFYCLERLHEGRLFFWLAIGISVLTSFTEFQGLFVWACWLPYLVLGGTVRHRVAWAIAAGTSLALYFLGYRLSEGLATAVHPSPLSVVPYSLVILGALFTGPLPAGTDTTVAVLLGLLIVAFALLAIWGAWQSGWNAPGFRLPLAVSIFGLVHVAVTAGGRSNLGLIQASSSRYATYTLLLVIGIYMILERAYAMKATLGKALALGACCLTIAVQFAASNAIGWPAGKALARDRYQDADVLVNYRMADDDAIQRYLWCCPAAVRQDAAILESDNLSIFASPLAAEYRQLGIAPSVAVSQTLPVPEPIADRVAGDDLANRAWGILSSVYASDDQLRARFGQPDLSTSREVLHWAALNAVDDPDAALFIDPYGDLYRELDRRVQHRPISLSGENESRNVFSRAGLDNQTGQSRWYLPPGFSLDARTMSISVQGSGSPTGDLYSGSEALPVFPGRMYAISADVDARFASGRGPCFYLAEVPSGLGFGMTCSRPGQLRQLVDVVRIPDNIWLVQWVAFTNDTAIAVGQAVRYSNIGIRLAR